jgi:hypothetical protein
LHYGRNLSINEVTNVVAMKNFKPRISYQDVRFSKAFDMKNR